MTDNLRDRIAKALFRNGFENLKWEDESEELREVLRGEADAVIAELGLQREKNLPLGDERCWICVAHRRRFHQPMHRHVTEWTTDE